MSVYDARAAVEGARAAAAEASAAAQSLVRDRAQRDARRQRALVSAWLRTLSRAR
jgi:hypothetical protein